jgi:hypothetical protein
MRTNHRRARGVRRGDRGGELTRCGRYVWHQRSRQHAQPLLFWFCSQVIGSRGLVHRTLLLSNLHFFVEVLFRRRWNEDCLRDSRDKTLVLAHGSSSAQGQQTFERKRSKFPAKRLGQPGREGGRGQTSEGVSVFICSFSFLVFITITSFFVTRRIIFSIGMKVLVVGLD